MALFVKDIEVDRLAQKLATLRRTTKTDVVRQALLHELERVEGVPSLVEQGVAFAKALRSRGKVASGQPADKAFIDGLYDPSDVR
jgi:antitoxin VapB